MTAPGRALCESVYCPPGTKSGWRFEALLDGRECRFYSYGRRALVEALRISGVTNGSTVALPALICRELLSAIYASGAVPSFYHVGKDLNVDGSVSGLPSCKAVVAVNYFGFPQALSPFREHCRRTGAVLIEDNAHGLFSRDSTGTSLGLRGDLGLFSLRKTLPIPNGAALVVNARAYASSLEPQLAFDSGLPSLKFCLKQSARRIAPVVGCRNLHRILTLVRQWKQVAGVFRMGPRSRNEERTLPQPERPSIVLSRPLRADIERETARRCALYRWLDEALRETGLPVAPVFPCLGASVVPYGYPFYADDVTLHKVRTILGAYGLECLSWPDLPEVVRDKAPGHYKTLRMVAFLW